MLERCIDCDATTGNAGWMDGSLFIDGKGPYCDDCYARLTDTDCACGDDLTVTD